jgi:hypothetical protein
MEIDPVEIGKFKKEANVENFVGIAKKTYAFINERGETEKAAGFASNTITHAQLLSVLEED